jgi:hypothetical protein
LLGLDVDACLFAHLAPNSCRNLFVGLEDAAGSLPIPVVATLDYENSAVIAHSDTSDTD